MPDWSKIDKKFHLSGLTFYINISKPCKIIFKNKLCKTIVNPSDETGRKSVSIPWEKLEYPRSTFYENFVYIS